ncbi:PREDICTED: uncharacterized protein LOC108765359 isoform X2 [Trachymyrmex cornetzi]|nr:PREDICTED: uncharacterized protein LOC108765359 isoform X2 [Trachymyrmex cornetzi]
MALDCENDMSSRKKTTRDREVDTEASQGIAAPPRIRAVTTSKTSVLASACRPWSVPPVILNPALARSNGADNMA